MDAQLALQAVRLLEAQMTLKGAGPGTSDNSGFALYLEEALATANPSPAPSGVSFGAPAGRGAGRGARWSTLDGLVDQAAADNGLPAGLVRAVVQVESGGDPLAKSDTGAMGLMQLMPGTAASLGVTDPYDPVQNLFAGARYLKGLIDRYGDLRLALAAYNAGPGTLSRLGVTDWERDQGMLPAETRAYVPKVLALAGQSEAGTGASAVE